MKPAPFAYHAPVAVDEALDLLWSLGEEAKLLAGGQSLGPMLNLRLATPSALIDLNRVDTLDYQRVDENGVLVIGPMTRHRTLERSAEIRRHWPLLHEAMPFIGHRAIRNRGTIGGSLAHADPAAELPAVIIAMGAQCVIEGASGRRQVAAEELFRTFFTTCLGPEEMLREVRIPAEPPRTGQSWMEFSPRCGDFALVGVAASVRLDAQRRYEAARLVYAGVADVPFVAQAAEELVGEVPSQEIHEEVGQAVATTIRPPSDVIVPSEFRRQLVRALTRRALVVAAARAQESDE